MIPQFVANRSHSSTKSCKKVTETGKKAKTTYQKLPDYVKKGGLNYLQTTIALSLTTLSWVWSHNSSMANRSPSSTKSCQKVTESAKKAKNLHKLPDLVKKCLNYLQTTVALSLTTLNCVWSHNLSNSPKKAQKRPKKPKDTQIVWKFPENNHCFFLGNPKLSVIPKLVDGKSVPIIDQQLPKSYRNWRKGKKPHTKNYQIMYVNKGA